MSADGQPLLACAYEDFDESFHARRKLLTMGSLLVDITTNAMASGFSPLVLPIGLAFRGPDASSLDTYAEGMFLYVYFVRFSVSILWGFVFLDAALSRHPERGGLHMSALALWPIGLTLLGWAVFQKNVALVMVAAVLMGIGHGPSKYNGGVLLPSWWAVDEKLRHCQALLGFFRGLGAILWIIFFGCMTSWVGEERVHITLYVTAVIQALLLCVAVFPVLSKAEFHKVPKPTCTSGVPSEFLPNSQQTRSLMADWRFYAVVIITTSIGFSGLGIKQLLAVLYQEGVQLAYSISTYYAAASLLLYWLLMTLSPLAGTRTLLLPMYGAVLALEGLLYGLSVTAVDLQNASLLLYCRILSGGLLAVMLINKTTLNVEVLGKDRLKKMKSLGAPLEVLGGAGGLAAWFLHVHFVEASRGQVGQTQEQTSFNTFFLLSAAMMFGSSFLVMCLWFDQLCAQKKNEPCVSRGTLV